MLIRTPQGAGYRPDDVLLFVLTAAVALPLAFLWWSPSLVLAVNVALLVVQSALGYSLSPGAVAAVFVAAFATAAFDRWRRSVAGGFVAAAGFGVIALMSRGLHLQGVLTTLLTMWVMLSIVWALGITVRVYRAGAARAERRAAFFAADREGRAREAVAEERERLARELHDSVGHALTVVVLHAGAAQRLLQRQPELARDALANIEEAGRQALADIERMLGILRADDAEIAYDATPGLAQLDALCCAVREAGLPVEVEVVGERRELSSSLDLTAYRIVQEALTNTLKHAGETRAHVRLVYAADGLTIDVVDDGRGVAAGEAGGGRGLLGMRERIVVFGGVLRAGPRAEGGFAVHAQLPFAKEDG